MRLGNDKLVMRNLTIFLLVKDLVGPALKDQMWEFDYVKSRSARIREKAKMCKSCLKLLESFCLMVWCRVCLSDQTDLYYYFITYKHLF